MIGNEVSNFILDGETEIDDLELASRYASIDSCVLERMKNLKNNDSFTKQPPKKVLTEIDSGSIKSEDESDEISEQEIDKLDIESHVQKIKEDLLKRSADQTYEEESEGNDQEVAELLLKCKDIAPIAFEKITKIGTVTSVTGKYASVKTEPVSVLDVGSIVCTENCDVIGVIADLFGPVSLPHYSVAILPDFTEKIKIDDSIYADLNSNSILYDKPQSLPQSLFSLSKDTMYDDYDADNCDGSESTGSISSNEYESDHVKINKPGLPVANTFPQKDNSDSLSDKQNQDSKVNLRKKEVPQVSVITEVCLAKPSPISVPFAPWKKPKKRNFKKMMVPVKLRHKPKIKTAKFKQKFKSKAPNVFLNKSLPFHNPKKENPPFRNPVYKNPNLRCSTTYSPPANLSYVERTHLISGIYKVPAQTLQKQPYQTYENHYEHVWEPPYDQQANHYNHQYKQPYNKQFYSQQSCEQFYNQQYEYQFEQQNDQQSICPQTPQLNTKQYNQSLYTQQQNNDINSYKQPMHYSDTSKLPTYKQPQKQYKQSYLKSYEPLTQKSQPYEKQYTAKHYDQTTYDNTQVCHESKAFKTPFPHQIYQKPLKIQSYVRTHSRNGNYRQPEPSTCSFTDYYTSYTDMNHAEYRSAKCSETNLSPSSENNFLNMYNSYAASDIKCFPANHYISKSSQSNQHKTQPVYSATAKTGYSSIYCSADIKPITPSILGDQYNVYSSFNNRDPGYSESSSLAESNSPYRYTIKQSFNCMPKSSYAYNSKVPSYAPKLKDDRTFSAQHLYSKNHALVKD